MTLAYAASVRALAAVLTVLNEQVTTTGSSTRSWPKRFAALNASPGARAYYDQARARGAEHNPALRQLANRLVGILHGCLKTGTLYDEATDWSHHVEKAAA